MDDKLRKSKASPKVAGFNGISKSVVLKCYVISKMAWKEKDKSRNVVCKPGHKYRVPLLPGLCKSSSELNQRLGNPIKFDDCNLSMWIRVKHAYPNSNFSSICLEFKSLITISVPQQHPSSSTTDCGFTTKTNPSILSLVYSVLFICELFTLTIT